MARLIIFTSRCVWFVFFFVLVFLVTPSDIGILVPQPGIKPVPPALEAQGLNHWPTREVPANVFFVFSSVASYG